MTKRHLKSFAAPKSWPGLLKKEHKHVIKGAPGPHSAELSMPLAQWLRHLRFGTTKREITHILNTKQVLIDGRRVKEAHFPLGFMDELSLPELNQNYRILIDELGKLKAVPSKAKGVKPCKITGKHVVPGGKTQFNFADGRTILAEKKEYAVGDTLVLEMPSQKVMKHLKLEKGAKIIITGGKRIGKHGAVESVHGDKLSFRRGDEVTETPKEYAYVIEEEFA